MSEQHILLDETNQIATITLNRPERMNAFGGRMRQQLAEALRVGLVNRVVPAEGLRSATQELAGRIARNAPLPIAFAKRGLQRFGHWDLAQALDYEVYVLETLRKTQDVAEGIAAFLEKRDPHFEGR